MFMKSKPGDVGVVADVDRLVDALQQPLALQGLHRGLVGDALVPVFKTFFLHH